GGVRGLVQPMRDGSSGMVTKLPPGHRGSVGRAAVRNPRKSAPAMPERFVVPPRRCGAVAGAGRVLGARAFLACLSRLAVHGVLAVPGAELLELDAVGIVAAVLARDVVALFALHARQRDLGTNVGRLGHGRVPFYFCG